MAETATLKKLICQKCQKLMDEKQFYKKHDGEPYIICKKCLTMHVDNFDEESYLWILKELDVPYVEEQWNTLRTRAYDKDPKKVNGSSVLGKYLATMKIKQWSKYHWEDTEVIKAEKELRKQEIKKQEEVFKANVKERFEKGEISEAQYKTLTTIEEQAEAGTLYAAPNQNEDVIGKDNFYRNDDYMSEEELDDIGGGLTSEDKKAMALKWGRLYKPSEWVDLEKKYQEMRKSFEVKDSDTEGTLLVICKTYLKMNQALDAGDIETFQKLSKVYESLRKSAKFTAAQNKEAENDFVTSIGEAVAYCELHGHKIPQYKIEEPLDRIDVIINDMKEYNKSLIYSDTTLASQIEDYLKRLKIMQQIKVDRQNNTEELTDKDYEEFLEQKAEEKEESKKNELS